MKNQAPGFKLENTAYVVPSILLEMLLIRISGGRFVIQHFYVGFICDRGPSHRSIWTGSVHSAQQWQHQEWQPSSESRFLSL